MLLDIIFRFGEHYYENEDGGNFLSTLFFTFLGAFFGFLFALWVDRLSTKKAKKEEKRQDKIKKYNQLRYFRDSIQAVIDYIPQQNQSFVNFAVNIRNSPLEIVTPEIRATYDLLRLKQVDNQENREAYFEFFEQSEETVRKYRRSIAHADYLHRIYTSSETDITRAVDFKHKDQLVVRDCIEELSMRLGMRIYYLEVNGQQISPEYEFISNLADVYTALIATFINFENAKNQFIDPIFMNSLQVIGDPDLAHELFVLARKASSRLRGIEGNALGVANDFDNFADQTDSAVFDLTALKELIDTVPAPD